MAKKATVLLALILIMILGQKPMLAADAKELIQQAEQKLNEADRLAGADKLAEAAAAFLQAAELYEQALQKDPKNSASRQNLLYSLGQRGMIHVRKGQKAIQEKNYEQAAGLYAAAIAAYDLAVSRQPQEKNFQVNREYCRREWGLAQFQVKLAARGPAYPFQLAGLDGSPVDLAKLKGKVVVLEFAAGWCPSCRESMPQLAEVQKRFKGKPVQVVVLALDRVEGWKKGGSEEKIMAWARETGLPFAWGDEDTCSQYGSFNSIPTVILIDRAGRLVAQVPHDDRQPEKLSRSITELLP